MFEIVELGGVKTVATKAACNHVYVVDVSYSMYNDLPKIRTHLKNIISMVAQPDDTFSVIYFSSRGQCGVVFENVLVSDVSTVAAMHDAIDRYIKPIGATGFMDPMKKAMELNLDPTKVNSYIMLTDGYDNQSNRGDLIVQAGNLPDVFKAVTFIEYGYYADRELLSAMAEAANGTHIFAEGSINYEEAVENAVRGVSRVNNIEVNVNKRAKHAMFEQNGQIKIVPAVDGVAKVPEDVERVYSVVPGDVLSNKLSEDRLYMILFYAAKTSDSDLVWKCLQAMGDVALVEKYQNAFTKQELSQFEELVSKAVLDPTLRYTQGKDLNAVPNKNAPTTIDLLNLLSASESFIVTDSPDWSYNRVGRASTTEAALPRFIQSPMSRVSMKGLVFSAERPNVSVQTTLTGQVELPANDLGLPKMVPSFITRNYTIIKDGIRNMEKLPVLFPSSLAPLVEHFAHEVIEEADGKCYWVFDLSRIPVINRAMVENVELSTFVKTVEALNTAKASLKVLGALIEEKGGSTAKIAGMIEKYGEEGAKWLSTIGVRDYGFSPVGTKSVEATDEYESIQVVYKIKGLSSLPAISAVRTKVESGKKLNLGDTLISLNLNNLKDLDQDVLIATKDTMTGTKRLLETVMANTVYTLVLGRKWYGDDEVVTTSVTLEGQVAEMTIEKVRKFIAI